MKMKLYMLARGHDRACVYNALRTIVRRGNQPNGIEQVPVSFVPGKITRIDAKLNMQPAIDDGAVVEVKKVIPKVIAPPVVAPKHVEPKAVVAPVVEEPVIAQPVASPPVVEPVEPVVEVDEPLEVDVGIMTATVDPGDDGKLGTDDDVVTITPKDKDDEVVADDDDEYVDDDGEEYVDDEAAEYEELEDGKFRCLVCARAGEEKILRTEKGMISHIEKTH